MAPTGPPALKAAIWYPPAMSERPWYKQFWPWFIFGLPGCVVVAGLTTWWIAERHADHLVADDYYKEGLAINRRLQAEQLAADLGLEAQLDYQDQRLSISLNGPSKPPALQITLSHPLNADLDREVQLAQLRPGLFQAELPGLSGNRWLWRLEPLGVADAARWRLNGELLLTP